MKTLLAVSLLALLAIPTHADSESTTYTYTGNTLNNSGLGSQLDPDAPVCQCNITGELTFAQPLNLPTDIQDTCARTVAAMVVEQRIMLGSVV
jgi:hypothetical protein